MNGRIAAAVEREGRPVTYQRGQALFTEGDRGERVFLVQEGWVVFSCAGPAGREIVLSVGGPGDVIGEMSAFDGEPRAATAVAVDEVRLIVAPVSVLSHAVAEIEGAHELIGILAARLRYADRIRVEFATLGTLGRVAMRLLELCDRFGAPGEEGITVAMPLSQEQLAGWCAASREATVKALAQLRTLQIITTGRRSVVVLDREALARQANGFA
jgi:CRP-like cAMP-binding protein